MQDLSSSLTFCCLSWRFEKIFCTGAMKYRCLSFILTAALWCSGCETVSTSHQLSSGAPRLSPSDPASVEVLRAAPRRPHLQLGEVRVQPSDSEADLTKIEAALRKEAAELGADAAVFISDETRAPAKYIGAWRTRESEPAAVRVVRALAIKYQ